MRAKSLTHRASYILIFNEQDQLYVQKRVSTKDYCPGYYDPCTGGVVDDGEDNLDNAYRELKEEMGIDLLNNNQKLTYHGQFYHGGVGQTCVWGNLYSCKWNGDVQIQETEVESVHLKTIDEIKQEFKTTKNTAKLKINVGFNVIFVISDIKWLILQFQISKLTLMNVTKRN